MIRFKYVVVLVATMFIAGCSSQDEPLLPVLPEEIVDDINRSYDLDDNLTMTVNGIPDSRVKMPYTASISDFNQSSAKFTLSTLPINFSKYKGFYDIKERATMPVFAGESSSLTKEIELVADSDNVYSFEINGSNKLITYHIAGKIEFDELKKKYYMSLNMNTLLKKFFDVDRFGDFKPFYCAKSDNIDSETGLWFDCADRKKDGHLVSKDIEEEYLYVFETLFNAGIFTNWWTTPVSFSNHFKPTEYVLYPVGFGISNNNDYILTSSFENKDERQGLMFPFYYDDKDEFIIFLDATSFFNSRSRIYRDAYRCYIEEDKFNFQFVPVFAPVIYPFLECGVRVSMYSNNYDAPLTGDAAGIVEKDYLRPVLVGEAARGEILTVINCVLDSEQNLRIVVEALREKFAQNNDVTSAGDYTDAELVEMVRTLKNKVESASEIRLRL